MSTLKNGIKKITFFVSTFLDCYKWTARIRKFGKNPWYKIDKFVKKYNNKIENFGNDNSYRLCSICAKRPQKGRKHDIQAKNL